MCMRTNLKRLLALSLIHIWSGAYHPYYRTEMRYRFLGESLCRPLQMAVGSTSQYLQKFLRDQIVGRKLVVV